MTDSTTLRRPILNIDLDNVVYDFVGAMQRYAEMKLGGPLPEWTEWNVWTQWGIPEGLWNFLFRQGVEEGAIWEYGDVIPGAVEGLWALSDQEWHIRLVTQRLSHAFGHDIAVTSTAEWLKRNSVPYRSLSFTGYNDSKANYDAVLLVDDSPTNVLAWNRSNPLRPAIIFDRPWNRDVVQLGRGVLVRAKNWTEVVELVGPAQSYLKP